MPRRHPLLLPSLCLALGLAASPAFADLRVSSQPFDFTKFNVGVGDWGDTENGVACTTIGSQAEWDAKMSPRAVGGENVFSPPEGFFDDKLLLVFAQELSGADADAVHVEDVWTGGDTLTLFYTLAESKPSSYTIYMPWGVTIANGGWEILTVTRNDEPVCQVDIN